MPTAVTVQPSQPAEPGEERLPYTDFRSIGAGFWIAQVGRGSAFGFALGYGTAHVGGAWCVPTFEFVNALPTMKRSVPGGVLDGCNDVESTWYQTYNEPPANETHQVKGWFGSVDWTRDTLYEFEITKAVTVDQTPPTEQSVCNGQPGSRHRMGSAGSSSGHPNSMHHAAVVDEAGRIVVVYVVQGATVRAARGTLAGAGVALPPHATRPCPQDTEIVEYADSECEWHQHSADRWQVDATVRVEPSDTEAFLNALDTARAAQS